MPRTLNAVLPLEKFDVLRVEEHSIRMTQQDQKQSYFEFRYYLLFCKNE
jgi:hypothetical protein